MQEFSGNILDGDKVLVEGIEGILLVNAPPGRTKSWHGTFNLPAGKHIKVGGTYRLELDDGRSGKIIIIRRLTTIPNASTVEPVEFKGSGPLQ
jgi:hypothetical protein